MKIRAALLVLLFLGLFVLCARLGEPFSGRGGGPGDALFAEGYVPRFEFFAEDSAWNWLVANAAREKAVPATLVLDGVELGRVALRFKGANTLRECVDGEGRLVCARPSLKVRFDRYDEDLLADGLKRLSFNALPSDGSMLRERLAYRIFREMGVPAPRASHAMVSVNGGPFGLYGMVENVDDVFAETRWGSEEGTLHKEVWPTSDPDAKKLNYPDAKGGGKRSSEAMAAFARAIRLADETGRTELLETFVDPAAATDYLAADFAVENVDGYRSFRCPDAGADVARCAPHNFYWRQSENADFFALVPWDHDRTFPDGAEADSVPDVAACETRVLEDGTATKFGGCDPFFRALRRNYGAQWRRSLEKLLAGPMAEGVPEGLLEEWAAELEPLVEEDPSKRVSDWRAEVEALKAAVSSQRAKMEKRLEAELRRGAPGG